MTAAGAAGAAAAALPRRGPAPRGRDAPAPAALLAAYMAAAALLFAATTLHGCGGGTPSAGDEAKERQDEGAAEKGPLELEQAGQYDPKHCQTLLQGQLEKYKEDLQKRCPVYLAALDDKFTVDYAAYPMCLELNKIAYHRAEVDLEKYRSNNDVSEEQAMKDKDGAVTAVFYRLERKIRRRLGEIVEGGRRLQQDVRTFVTLVLEIDKNVSSEQLVTEIDEFFDFEKNWAFFSNVILSHCVPVYMDMCVKPTTRARQYAKEKVLQAMEEFKKNTPEYKESSFLSRQNLTNNLTM